MSFTIQGSTPVYAGPAPDMLTRACQTANIQQVMMAIAQGARPDEQTLDAAIKTSNFSVVQAVISAGAFPSSGTLTAAFNTGVRDIIDAVYTKGAQPDAHTMSAAIRSAANDPHRNNIRLAEQAGAKYDFSSFETAAIFNIKDLVGHCLRGGYKPTTEMLHRAYDDAKLLQYGNGYDLYIFEEFLKTGVKVDPTKPYILEKIVRTRHPNLLQLAMKAGGKHNQNTFALHFRAWEGVTLTEEFFQINQLLITTGAKIERKEFEFLKSRHFGEQKKHMTREARAELDRLERQMKNAIQKK